MTAQTQHHRRDVQGLRAIAVVAVLLYHAGKVLPGGFIGVDIFFVISGFVITSLLIRDFTSGRRFSFGRFYGRRFRRLSPPLAVVVCCVLVVSALTESPLGAIQVTTTTAIGAMTFAANAAIAATSGGYFEPNAESNPLLHTWSLAVEEQFYLFFPLLLFLAFRFGRRSDKRRSLAVAAVAVISTASFLLMLSREFGVQVFSYRTDEIFFYSPFARVWEFGAGCLLAFSPIGLVKNRRALQVAYPFSIGVIAYSFVSLSGGNYPGLATVPPVLATVALIAAGSDRSQLGARVLSTRPLHFLGDISYGWYLWHWPAIVLVGDLWSDSRLPLLFAAAISIVPALLSQRLVESPLREWHPRDPAAAMRRVVALSVGTPLLLATALGIVVRSDLMPEAVQYLRDGVVPDHLGTATGCANGLLQPVWLKPECTWPAPEPSPGSKIYLVGDSNADQFSESIRRVATDSNRPLQISTANGCPFVDLTISRSDWSPSYDGGCNSFTADILSWLQSQPPGTVIISSSNTYWGSAQASFATRGGDLTDDPAAKLDLYRRGLDSAVSKLQAAGHQVILVQTVPQWGGRHPWSPLDCSIFDLMASRCKATMSLEESTAQNAPARGVLAHVARDHQIVVVEPREFLCRPDCSTERDGLVLYKDRSHISVVAATALAPLFAAAIG